MLSETTLPAGSRIRTGNYYDSTKRTGMTMISSSTTTRAGLSLSLSSSLSTSKVHTSSTSAVRRKSSKTTKTKKRQNPDTTNIIIRGEGGGDDNNNLVNNDDDPTNSIINNNNNNSNNIHRKEHRRSQSWIMLVDDEESIRIAVGQLLQSHGYGKVTTSCDGVQALQDLIQYVIEYNDKDNDNTNDVQSDPIDRKMIPDCLVTDLRMPVMDGIELIKNIRQLSQHQQIQQDGAIQQSLESLSEQQLQQLAQIPIVILSAKGAVQDRIQGYDTGADGYLSKPFDPEELIAICDQVLERYEADTAEADVVPTATTTMISTRSELDDDTNTIRVPTTKLTKSASDQVEELKNDIDEIKRLLLEQGGGGIVGVNGYVERTGVFLSKDERRVLELLSDGLMTKEIASETHLSTRRIEQLLTRMFRKTDTRNRTELVRWAVATGNVDRT